MKYAYNMKFSNLSSIVILSREDTSALSFENFILYLSHTFHISYYKYIFNFTYYTPDV